MKLFAIRVENNEAVLVTAVSAEEALESVGLLAVFFWVWMAAPKGLVRT